MWKGSHGAAIIEDQTGTVRCSVSFFCSPMPCVPLCPSFFTHVRARLVSALSMHKKKSRGEFSGQNAFILAIRVKDESDAHHAKTSILFSIPQNTVRPSHDPVQSIIVWICEHWEPVGLSESLLCTCRCQKNLPNESDQLSFYVVYVRVRACSCKQSCACANSKSRLGRLLCTRHRQNLFDNESFPIYLLGVPECVTTDTCACMSVLVCKRW